MGRSLHTKPKTYITRDCQIILTIRLLDIIQYEAFNRRFAQFNYQITLRSLTNVPERKHISTAKPGMYPWVVRLMQDCEKLRATCSGWSAEVGRALLPCAVFESVRIRLNKSICLNTKFGTKPSSKKKKKEKD